MKLLTEKKLSTVYKRLAALRYIAIYGDITCCDTFTSVVENYYNIAYDIGGLDALRKCNAYYNTLCKQMKPLNNSKCVKKKRMGMKKVKYSGCLYEECHFCQCHYCFNDNCFSKRKSPQNEYYETCEDCRSLGMSYETGGGYSIGRANCENYIGVEWEMIDKFLQKDLQKGTVSR